MLATCETMPVAATARKAGYRPVAADALADEQLRPDLSGAVAFVGSFEHLLQRQFDTSAPSRGQTGDVAREAAARASKSSGLRLPSEDQIVPPFQAPSKDIVATVETIAPPLARAAYVHADAADRVFTGLDPAGAFLGPAKAETPEVRTVRVQLHPENLGKIEVRIALAQGECRISIVAENAEAVRALHGEKERLISEIAADVDPDSVVSVEIAQGSREERATPESGMPDDVRREFWQGDGDQSDARRGRRDKRPQGRQEGPQDRKAGASGIRFILL